MHHSDYMEDFNNAIGFGMAKQVTNFKLNNKDLFDNDVMQRDVQVDEVVYQKEPDFGLLISEGNSRKNTFLGAKIGSSLGFIVALGYAFKVKSGFLKGFGYTILGSMAFGGLGAGVGLAIDSRKNEK